MTKTNTLKIECFCHLNIIISGIVSDFDIRHSDLKSADYLLSSSYGDYERYLIIVFQGDLIPIIYPNPDQTAINEDG